MRNKHDRTARYMYIAIDNTGNIQIAAPEGGLNFDALISGGLTKVKTEYSLEVLKSPSSYKWDFDLKKIVPKV